MTQEHPSKLSFSIEESVWLNRSQEVEEILGMSLEPEIVIEEKDHHVYIKGGLRLVGEYRSSNSDSAVDAETSLQEQVSFRSAGDVTVTSDGTGEIKHFFPIDVTIPISRIQNLDDVYVQVESFDYDLPEKSCIQLTADISISGMTQQLGQTEKRDEKAPKQEETPRVEAAPQLEEAPELEAVPTAFSFEARKRPELEQPVQERVAPPTAVPPTPAPTAARTPRPFDQYQHPFGAVPQQPPAYQRPVYEPEKQQPVVEKEPVAEAPTTRLPQQEQEEPALTTNESRYDDQYDDSVETEELEEVRAEQQEVEEVEVEEEVVEEVREAPPAPPETKINLAPLKEMATAPAAEAKGEEDAEVEDSKPLSAREENALYLTKMLSKGEERFSKWKMCIIQENESLDTIADRYEISTSQLVRMNRLQGEQVEEGQILYIPVRIESK
ncbi:stage VI sporulation protein D [Halalkalibacter akibai]|uniref:Stage VI sporulation protein D n=1 Tax=Halalkalibacter akibai (strain ATCC 43226 / DSM 21942 / CIP 109018 / JCM 9157 / 1139) TaxID=1236973 RepID=W4QSS3_HALA3|nr:stage VI sporulation protein D [Halalkalibacter akibai]GAE34932.1 stage VI sporulation protein D [Halalkalibacter akibai JCM 9157]